MGTYSKAEKIDPIRLEKELVDRLSSIIQSEYEKSNPDSRATLEFIIKKKLRNMVYKTTDIQKFLYEYTEKDLASLEIYYHDYRYSRYIRVDIDLTGLESKFSVEGEDTDPNWVDGVFNRILDLFKLYTTHNNFVRSKVVWIIYFVVAFFTSIITLFYLNKLVGVQNSTWQIAIAFFGILFWLHYLFDWLYPKVETNSMIQIRIRKFIFLVVGSSIALSILSNFIYDFLKGGK